MRLARLVLASTVACGALVAVSAQAQRTAASDLDGVNGDALVEALIMRYDAALAKSLDNGTVAANDSRYLWAIEAKVQCAIALGYMKSSTRDEPSISKCGRAYDMMMRTPMPTPVASRPVAPPQPPVSRPDFCRDAGLVTIFFEFDSVDITPEGNTILGTVAQQAATCGWSTLTVVGHTDQAGSDQYNLTLSQRRADAVATVLRTRVPTGTQIMEEAQGEKNPRVPLADGTRSPENRRVEITGK